MIINYITVIKLLKKKERRHREPTIDIYEERNFVNKFVKIMYLWCIILCVFQYGIKQVKYTKKNENLFKQNQKLLLFKHSYGVKCTEFYYNNFVFKSVVCSAVCYLLWKPML